MTHGRRRSDGTGRVEKKRGEGEERGGEGGLREVERTVIAEQ